MPRILGVDIPGNKKAKISLTYLFGIGQNTAIQVCKACKIDPEQRMYSLDPEKIGQINTFLQKNYQIEGDLRRQTSQNIRRLVSIRCYRGLRHQRSLPVHGQRTKTNARTRKGSKRTVGAIRDKSTRKMERAS